ncbi:hypothetical protein [Sediminibacillus halophilus]|uniref:Uncharacterized protein n=1 Tax=Sediminibacillus halophilus TaxID=482461 RepID=A0A1G9WBV5_9BACI|nr:hypothetical protein [Sediminibacillus halophilus]SDM81701.1 hypothetical protein SAMN05216244_3499 [Sediminibacillus halophilus]
MNKRYIKVLGLYTLSTLIPAVIFSEEESAANWAAKTAAGYGIFAYGLKVMTKRKNA